MHLFPAVTVLVATVVAIPTELQGDADSVEVSRPSHRLPRPRPLLTPLRNREDPPAHRCCLRDVHTIVAKKPEDAALSTAPNPIAGILTWASRSVCASVATVNERCQRSDNHFCALEIDRAREARWNTSWRSEEPSRHSSRGVVVSSILVSPTSTT
ncbi:hypothetical protein B0T25DRAFT_245055 [Lasiosphaeria hispida]|uniref:Secreted protein n=1 Tax=Lasiosphaeria hispida TaxID=260671 RepID=A0AAJ0MCE5_9PEZI|nr:hypothetical protein B0T25DRAFT_245055 [Lasiosphaeria hispida]